MRRRAFAMIMVLLVLAIVGMLVWEIGAWTRGRMASATSAVRDAQIEQLLLAGIREAPRVLQGEQGRLEIAVPQELGARLTLERTGEASQVRIIVEYAGTRREQTASFTRSGGGWRLTGLSY